MNMSGKLVYKWHSGEICLINIEKYSDFSHLKLDENNIAYFIASGPKRATSVIAYDIENKKVNMIKLLSVILGFSPKHNITDLKYLHNTRNSNKY